MDLAQFDNFNTGKLKELRDERGWTQDKLSEISGVPQSTLSRLESGKDKKDPTASAVFRLAATFGVSPMYFYNIETTEDEDMRNVWVHKDNLVVIKVTDDARVQGIPPAKIAEIAKIALTIKDD